MTGFAAQISHFEIYGRDPAALADFYEEVLGWSATKAPGVDYWRIATGAEASVAIGGGITFRPLAAPNGWLCYARVTSLDETVARALSLGGSVIRPKMAVPKTAWYAQIADPEGNVFGVWQPDSTAFPPPEPD